MWMMLSNKTTTTPKDAYGFDTMSTYLPLDGLGINALPDSEKYKRVSGKTQRERAPHFRGWPPLDGARVWVPAAEHRR